MLFASDRWNPHASSPGSSSNLNSSHDCASPKSALKKLNENTNTDFDENTGIDQVVTDLAILEHQLINSVTVRKDPLFIRPDLKDTIINDLDHYFEDKSSSFNEQYKADLSVEQTPVEHIPYINTFNQTSTDTRIIINGLKNSQMYVFQVFACHDLTKESKADACSLNGIIITVRTKPGDRKYSKKTSHSNISSVFFSFKHHWI